MIERLVDAFDGDDFHALDTLPGLVCRRDDGAVESKLRGFSQSLLTALYGPDFVHVARPTQIIAGTVRDKVTGKPLAGVTVNSGVRQGWWENAVYATTDSDGTPKPGLLASRTVPLMLPVFPEFDMIWLPRFVTPPSVTLVSSNSYSVLQRSHRTSMSA